MGKKDYFLGNHPLWQCFRVLYQMTRKPYVIGGLLLLYGYISAFLGRMKRPISQELIDFNRKEQLERIRLTLRGLLKLKMKSLRNLIYLRERDSQVSDEYVQSREVRDQNDNRDKRS